MKTRQEKLKEAYEYARSKGIVHTQKEFALLIGFSKVNISSAMNGDDRYLTDGLFSSICDSFHELNLDYFIKNDGNMIKSGSQSEPKDDNIPLEKRTIKSVPLIPIEAVAGFPGLDNDGVVYNDCEQYVVPEFEERGYEFVIRVSGSSMYPKYSNGDILACKKIKEILFFQWGKVYVIDSSQGVLVKRVFEDKENNNNIMLVSDNKDNYPPFSIPKEDIRSLSIVLGVIRME